MPLDYDDDNICYFNHPVLGEIMCMMVDPPTHRESMRDLEQMYDETREGRRVWQRDPNDGDSIAMNYSSQYGKSDYRLVLSRTTAGGRGTTYLHVVDATGALVGNHHTIPAKGKELDELFALVATQCMHHDGASSASR